MILLNFGKQSIVAVSVILQHHCELIVIAKHSGILSVHSVHQSVSSTVSVSSCYTSNASRHSFTRLRGACLPTWQQIRIRFGMGNFVQLGEVNVPVCHRHLIRVTLKFSLFCTGRFKLLLILCGQYATCTMVMCS